MTGRFSFIFVAGVAALGTQMAQAQSAGLATVQQIPSRSTAPVQQSDSVRVVPVRGSGSSASAREGQREAAASQVAPETVEACRASQAEDRPPPKGVDCLAVMQALAKAQPEATAEGSLLQLFGQNGNVTGAPALESSSSVNADNVARQLSTGEVAQSADGTAAGIVARGRDAPPPR